MSATRICLRCRRPFPAGPVKSPYKCTDCGFTSYPSATAAPAPAVNPVPTRPASRKWLLVSAALALIALAAVGAVAALGKRAHVPEPAAPAVVAAAPVVPAPIITPAIAPVVAPAPDVPESMALGWKFGYDEGGRINRLENPAGQVTTLRYELDATKVLRKIVREMPDGSTVTQEFDRDGRRVAMTDSFGKVVSAYDGLGRLTDVKREGAPPIHYGYDSQDRVSLFQVGNEYVLKYGYDFLGRLEAIDTPAGRITYDYSAKDRTTTRTLPNGVRTTRTHAPSGRLEKIEHTAAGGTLLARFAYEYRPDGLIREVRESSAEGETRVTYEYDTVQRLVSVADTRGSRTSYRYDLLGNREEVRENDRPAVGSTFDWVGRLVRHGGERCAHDASGNVTRYAGTHGPTTLTHSAEGQLLSATTDKAAVKCRYDGEGNLVERSVNGTTTSFVADPLAEIWQPLLATDARGTQTAYVWDGNAPLAEKVNGEWKFFLHNHQDSVRCVVDARGQVVERPEYCPFGRPLRDAGNDLRPGFAGLFYDPQTALYLTRARA